MIIRAKNVYISNVFALLGLMLMSASAIAASSDDGRYFRLHQEVKSAVNSDNKPVVQQQNATRDGGGVKSIMKQVPKTPPMRRLAVVHYS